MKQISLGFKFYVLFSLVLVVPASWMASKIESCIATFSTDSYLHYLSSIGVIGAPTTVVILFLFFMLFDNYFWRLPVVINLIGVPNINGRYTGELTSSHTIDNEQNGTYPAVIEIKQSLTSVIVNLYTERSCSYSLIASICKNQNGNYEIAYIYQNQTSAMASDADMRDHHGAVLLEISQDGKMLSGNYFNNPRERGRYGKIFVKKISDKIKGYF